MTGTGGARPPAWFQETDLALTVYPQILLLGNVRDRYLLPGEQGRPVVLDLPQALWTLFRRRGYAGMLRHDIVQDRIVWERIAHQEAGGRAADRPAPPAEAIDRALTPAGGDVSRIGAEARSGSDFQRLRSVMAAVAANRDSPPVSLLLPFAGRLGDPGQHQLENTRLFFAAAEALAHEAGRPRVGGLPAPYNTIVWVAERQEDLPASFAMGNARIRVITLPRPDPATRARAARYALHPLLAELPEAEAERHAVRLSRLTHGMGLVDVYSIGQLAHERDLDPDRLEEAARLYRVGVVDDPWSDPGVLEQIRNGEATLNRRVRGQRDAVRKTMDIFMRSATGLTGAHASSSPNRPRGVLFLSGPTGVGKTELAKGIAELILGEDAEPVRFDMSEFAAEHARERLIGAPPGYVGFEAGGELTNAVRAAPVSVLLFDEIEKADPGIFDLFLQILEDGRLTDGRGATVYFTECVLIFTSNLGVAKLPEHLRKAWEARAEKGETIPVLTPDLEPGVVREALRTVFNAYFSDGIGRPELLNRFGDGFVAMDFIDDDVAGEILDLMLASVVTRVESRHRAHLSIGPSVRAFLAYKYQEPEMRAQGGRAVGRIVETHLTDPLARELFLRPARPGERITAAEVVIEPDKAPELVVEREDRQGMDP
ncbi:AAA family ATPase [Nocardiopsis sp. CC223A]|uniref:AAA family ATPase n=1 Tax=Nocardiopsis sp. CC223A TaxID=3044051 RepID=UPI00278BCED4|nr:AAA family ATPase [Nocardiopsis sp. CC223A]